MCKTLQCFGLGFFPFHLSWKLRWDSAGFDSFFKSDFNLQAQCLTDWNVQLLRVYGAAAWQPKPYTGQQLLQHNLDLRHFPQKSGVRQLPWHSSLTNPRTFVNRV